MFRISFSQLFFIFATLSTAANAQVTTQAQDTLTVFEESNNNGIPKEIADNVKKYKLGKITITGNTNYNENSIYAIGGLVRGQEISIPGEELSNAIHKLWNMNIFRSEEHTSELQSRENLVCRLLLEKKKTNHRTRYMNRY